jgi:prohibitin 2
MEQYAEMARRYAMQSRRNLGGGGGRPPMLAGAVALLGIGGFMVLQNSLFNVDGGHRAIKYRRINGVSKEIYGEGTDTSTSTSTYTDLQDRPHPARPETATAIARC